MDLDRRIAMRPAIAWALARVDQREALARHAGSGFRWPPPLLEQEVDYLEALLETTALDWRAHLPRLAELLLGTPGYPWATTAELMRPGRVAGDP